MRRASRFAPAGLLAALLAALAGCAAPSGPAPAPQGPQQIATEAAFRAGIVGRDLADAETGAVLRIVPNGSWLERRANHVAASGTWGWAGTLWCHEGRRDGRLFARDCLPVVQDGAAVSLGPRRLTIR